MNAGLGAHVAERVSAFDEERGGLDACLLAVLAIDFGDVPVALFPEVQIHPREHLRPVLRLGPTLAGLDGDEAVERIVFAVEQALELDLLAALLEFRERSVGLIERVL